MVKKPKKKKTDWNKLQFNLVTTYAILSRVQKDLSSILENITRDLTATSEKEEK